MVQLILIKRESLDTTSYADSDAPGFLTFHGDDALKEESGCRLWNLIFSAAVDSIETPSADLGVASYTSEN